MPIKARYTAVPYFICTMKRIYTQTHIDKSF